MRSLDNKTFGWLMAGAFLGAVAVFVFDFATRDENAIYAGEYSISAWVAALVPTVGAILFGLIGPTIGVGKHVVDSAAQEQTQTRGLARY